MKILKYLAIVLLIFISCKNDTSTATAGAMSIKPVVFDGIDMSIKPGDDFFNHVNKKWFAETPIADDQVGAGAYRFLNIPQ